MYIYEVVKFDDSIEQWQIELDEYNYRWRITSLTKETIFYDDYASFADAERDLETFKKKGFIKDYMKSYF